MSPIFRVMSKLRPYIYLNTNGLYHFSSPTCHHFSFHNLGNDLVTNSGPKWSFLGLVSVLHPIGLDTKKPRNYLIVRGLSRIFRFSSEVHSGDGGSRTLVQTWTQKGFYMLSHPIGFRPRAGWWRPTRGLAP